MEPNLQTREDAIGWLLAKGLHATVRDWKFGPTVCVCAGENTVIGGIRSFRYMLCIYPLDNEWTVADTSRGGHASWHGSLTDAAQRAVSILNEKLMHETHR